MKDYNKSFFCSLAIVLGIVFLGLTCGALHLVSIFKNLSTSNNPSPKPPQISVQAISLSASENFTTFDYHVHLNISNPNLHDFIFYEDVLVNIRLFSKNGNTSLPFHSMVPAFNQTSGNITSLEFNVMRKIGDGERNKRGVVGKFSSFRVKAMGLVTMGCGDVYLDVLCEGFYEVEDLAASGRDGVFPGGPKKCKTALTWF